MDAKGGDDGGDGKEEVADEAGVVGDERKVMTMVEDRERGDEWWKVTGASVVVVDVVVIVGRPARQMRDAFLRGWSVVVVGVDCRRYCYCHYHYCSYCYCYDAVSWVPLRRQTARLSWPRSATAAKSSDSAASKS